MGAGFGASALLFVAVGMLPVEASAFFTTELKRGDVHLEANLLNAFLSEQGYPVSTDGDRFDAHTEKALELFQLEHAEAGGVTGVLNAQTRSTINNVMQSEQSVLGASTDAVFNTNLIPGMDHEDVRRLQVFLNQNGFTVAETGFGSIGNETTSYGAKTQYALMRYQDAHAETILMPLGLTKGTGLFLEYTRNIVNAERYK